ncbi:MAG: hypothetical protein IJA87_09670 [Clostridia bacterium]|nr:hypothetical protein [Clostridia bacterium]
MEKTPFFKKTWFIIIALIFIPPLGIALMWISKKQWKSVIKIILSVVLGFWTLILGIAIFSPADETSATESETTTIENSDAEDVTEPATKKPISETKPVTSTTSPTTTETVTESTTEQETTNQPTTTKPATTAKPTTTKPTTTKAPATQNAGTNYVLNNNTMKFHYPTCRAVDDISPENKGTFKGDRQTLINRGYKSCGICHP